jgi:hypothetical protein
MPDIGTKALAMVFLVILACFLPWLGLYGIVAAVVCVVLFVLLAAAR